MITKADYTNEEAGDPAPGAGPDRSRVAEPEREFSGAMATATAYPPPPANSITEPPASDMPPAPARRRGWRKWWAIAGVAGGFTLLVIPGFFALRSYVKWEKGEKGRPLFAWIWACITLAFVALAVAGSALVPAPANATIQDDFSHPGSGWAVGNSSLATAGYLDGAYRILVKSQADTEDSLFFVSKSSKAITVQADVRKAVAAGPEIGIGVECLVRRGTVYAFIVDPDAGQYAIVRVVGDQPTILQEGSSSVINRGGATNLVRGDCIGDWSNGPSRLTLQVNGQRIFEAVDANGLGSFNGMGLVASSLDQGGAEARFDNAVEHPFGSGR